MAVYVVTWNLNDEKDDYDEARDAFIAQLERYDNCRDLGLESVRFISTSHNSSQVSEFLRRKLDTTDRLFVSKLHRGQYRGWLNKRVWDWIRARL
ncbi:hypothetical protein Q8W71_28780 [Methylobacterium sp. NEAU 140]|uniref:hypothetical protein n=1 Tax=Methylobacterium sp. NEAU 140 TaxID=3064945 RepID=UPI0027375A79|nr:hypothetical protein [Methylobacterium sp. NEAU 140]MDP4026608.1 hypothetical protein [Methylobacterium sp. NEAU 140]